MTEPAASLDEMRALAGASARPRSRSRHRRGAAPGAADQARRLARPARGAGDLARDLAGAAPAAARSSAHDRLRRQSRRRRARRLGLSRLGDGADGAELHRRRRGGEPAVPRRRRRSPGLRDEPRRADRRHRRRAGDERGGMRPGDGLRHDGGRARHRRVGGGRDGHRQHHRGGGAVLGAVRRRRRSCGPAPAPGSPGRRSTTNVTRSAQAAARHRPAARDPFDLLRRLGGLEFAAIAGAVMAARLGRVPVVLDGFAATAAAAVLYRRRRARARPLHRRPCLGRAGPSRFCSSIWASGRCSISACGSARPRARRSRSAC